MRSEQVYWVFTVAVDQMDKFTPLIPKLVAATGKEPGALQFECNIGDDQKTADFFERYTEMRPGFSHHAEGTLPGLVADGILLTVVAGEAFGQRSPVPVYSDLMYVDIVLKPGARLQVPAQHVERAMFVVSGEIEVAGQIGTFSELQLVVFKPGADVVLQARGGAHLMLVGGEPFPEPRHVYWNFVSSSQDRIKQASDDWRQGRFAEIAGETEFIPLLPDLHAS